jgi:hypothetical protein
MHKPSIYEALRDKLGREPTNAEVRADVERIKTDALVKTATGGKLRHQKRHRRRAPARQIISIGATTFLEATARALEAREDEVATAQIQPAAAIAVGTFIPGELPKGSDRG